MKYCISLGDLRRALHVYDDDVQVYFGGLDFVRIKNIVSDEGEDGRVRVVMFEFSPSVYESKTGKVMLATDDDRQVPHKKK